MVQILKIEGTADECLRTEAPICIVYPTIYQFSLKFGAWLLCSLDRWERWMGDGLSGGVPGNCGKPGRAGRGGQPLGQVRHSALQASQGR